LEARNGRNVAQNRNRFSTMCSKMGVCIVDMGATEIVNQQLLTLTSKS